MCLSKCNLHRYAEVAGGEAAVSVGQDVRFKMRMGGDRRGGGLYPKP
jgi:hypothetical protein